MAKFKVTVRKNHSGGSNVVVVYWDRASAKVAYDEAIAGAVIIFGPEMPEAPHFVMVEELPES